MNLRKLIFKSKSDTSNSNSYLYFKIIIAILVIAFIAIVALKPTNIKVNSNYLQIKGHFGEKINMTDITNVTLEESMPKIITRTFGMDLFGQQQIGTYKVEGLGKGKLFLRSKKGPYLSIFTKDTFYILSFKDTEKTKDLYNEINKYWNK